MAGHCELPSSVDIERVSAVHADPADLRARLPRQPFIVTDAASQWPAREKWNMRFFASRDGSEIGIVPVSFGAPPTTGKLTMLSAFIEHLEDDYAEIPGLWVGGDDPSGAANSTGWSFLWDAFKSDPRLFDDVFPFPPSIPNLTASLPRDVYDAFEQIQRRQFTSIYISRQNTITPLHRDRDHVFGCLVQFHGRKRVVLFPAGTYESADEGRFDPENPDFELYPSMRSCVAHTAVLEPTEMLIIPPDWPHYTRAENHSITLSHSFFNEANLGAYIRCVLHDLTKREDGAELLKSIGTLLVPNP